MTGAFGIARGPLVTRLSLFLSQTIDAATFHGTLIKKGLFNNYKTVFSSKEAL
jgi:hypothetical protein